MNDQWWNVREKEDYLSARETMVFFSNEETEADILLNKLRPLLQEYLALPSSDGNTIRQALRRKIKELIQ